MSPSSENKSPLQSLADHKWRLLGLVVTVLVAVVVLPMTQPDTEATRQITAQELVRAQLGEVTEALDDVDADGVEAREVRVAYRGIDELESTVWQQASQVADLRETDDSRAPLLEFSTAIDDSGALHVEIAISAPDGTELARSDGTQRIGDWTSILPPLIAILAALFIRQIVVAMAAGVWLGAIIAADYAPLDGTWQAGEYLTTNLTSPFNLYIIGFTFALVGMVHVVIRMGGMEGVLNRVAALAKSAQSTRIATALMGFVMFFDDYANTIVVGSTMRPLSDENKISREKLAYIVDSTAAPIAGVAIISTWIGYEVGLFEDLAHQLHLDMSGYEIFLGIIPFRFYCIFALALVLWNVVQSRDFGPMLAAERRASTTGKVLADDAVPLTSKSFLDVGPKKGVTARWYNAAIPVGTVIVATMAGIFWSGGPDEGITPGDVASWQAWQDAFSNADSAMVLFWAAAIGSIVAVALAVVQRLLKPLEALKAWLKTIPSMWMAVAILVLAWAIRTVCEDLGTSIYLVGAVEGLITLTMLPLITFGLAAVVAFATGTSWGAMGILLPTMIPLAFQMGDGSAHAMLILMLCFAAVLDGAIYGDHCSPISDTTILSSVATGSDHIDHVRTQAPYATVAMVVAAGCGYIGVALGLSPWLALPIGILAVGLVMRLFGKVV